ncbi:hypothetical protein EJ110_NYTH45561 [Nymphaea thermarum]|nr:hypothetical protein EJ110_NYTH45561 [Nymphaea thermarum]
MPTSARTFATERTEHVPERPWSFSAMKFQFRGPCCSTSCRSVSSSSGLQWPRSRAPPLAASMLDDFNRLCSIQVLRKIHSRLKFSSMEAAGGGARPRGHWRPEEDETLRQLVEQHGPQNWNFIAEKLQGY